MNFEQELFPIHIHGRFLYTFELKELNLFYMKWWQEKFTDVVGTGMEGSRTDVGNSRKWTVGMSGVFLCLLMQSRSTIQTIYCLLSSLLLFHSSAHPCVFLFLGGSFVSCVFSCNINGRTVNASWDIFFLLIYFIDYAITVVPFSPLHSPPPCTPPPAHIPPL